MRREKLAIVGTCSSTRGAAPLNNEEWELWGVNELGAKLPGKWDAHFNLHQHDQIPAANVQWLKDTGNPVYMLYRHPDIPNSVAYPFEEVSKVFTRDYWASSIAYMIALGVVQGFKTIGIWGVDMALNSEYQYQRPNCEYVIGKAEGMGVTVHVPDAAQLCHCQWRYGYEPAPKGAYVNLISLFAREREKTAQELHTARKSAYFHEGVVHGLQWAAAQLNCAQREVAGWTSVVNTEQEAIKGENNYGQSSCTPGDGQGN